MYNVHSTTFSQANCVGIEKHFMVAEIPGFDLPNRLSNLTESLFSSVGIGTIN